MVLEEMNLGDDEEYRQILEERNEDWRLIKGTERERERLYEKVCKVNKKETEEEKKNENQYEWEEDRGSIERRKGNGRSITWKDYRN